MHQVDTEMLAGQLNIYSSIPWHHDDARRKKLDHQSQQKSDSTPGHLGCLYQILWQSIQHFPRYFSWNKSFGLADCWLTLAWQQPKEFSKTIEFSWVVLWGDINSERANLQIKLLEDFGSKKQMVLMEGKNMAQSNCWIISSCSSVSWICSWLEENRLEQQGHPDLSQDNPPDGRGSDSKTDFLWQLQDIKWRLVHVLFLWGCSVLLLKWIKSHQNWWHVQVMSNEALEQLCINVLQVFQWRWSAEQLIFMSLMASSQAQTRMVWDGGTSPVQR